MLILNFFRRQAKKVAQNARIVVSLDMEQIASITNGVITPWCILGLITVLTVIVLPIVLVMEKIERRRK